MPKQVTIYTTRELMSALNCTKQNINRLAKEQNWQHISGYTGDITEYLWSRFRRDLARQMGVEVTGRVHHDEWDRDDNCPVCGGFAIWKPMSEELVSKKSIENWPWLCVNGHSNENGE